ncbi:MAG: tRNA (guanosine(46)-N7)-methyltransferase TrmB [Hyphomicrobiaceae bacterium]
MSKQPSQSHTDELRSFGRRRGRKFSDSQTALMNDVLPCVRLDLDAAVPKSLAALFNPVVEDVWLEIGFGGGEHLLWQAEHNRDVGLIGCEPFEDGVVKVLRGVEDQALANVRVHDDDARDVLRWLPEASISRAFVLFPDPWPKARHRKRRLVNTSLLNALARVMCEGGELRIGTDIGDYARWMMIALQEADVFEWTAKRPDDWRKRPGDWPQTRYEQKARREGRCCYFLSLKKKQSV